MSEERVLAFFAKADTDEALGNKLAQVEPGDGALDQVVKIAAEAGFDVTASEIISVGRASLSDEELESVAGGVIGQANGLNIRSSTSTYYSSSGRAVKAIMYAAAGTVKTKPRIWGL